MFENEKKIYNWGLDASLDAFGHKMDVRVINTI
jgi:hypothetical protein